jgi:plastocyanin
MTGLDKVSGKPVASGLGSITTCVDNAGREAFDSEAFLRRTSGRVGVQKNQSPSGAHRSDRSFAWVLSLLAIPVGAWAAGASGASSLGQPVPQSADQSAGDVTTTETPDSRSAPTEPKGTGSVSGLVTATSKQRRAPGLPEMIVYLDPLDPGQRLGPPGQPVVISQKGAKFSPALLVISVGQSVEFRNDEDRPIEHNVFSRSPVLPFDLGLYRPGTSKSVTFDKPGAVRLYCSVHRYMDGVIYVCPTPFFAQVGKDGRYAIEGVPPGEYYLKTWQRRRRYPEQSQAVTVSAGRNSAIDLELSRK